MMKVMEESAKTHQGKMQQQGKLWKVEEISRMHEREMSPVLFKLSSAIPAFFKKAFREI